MDTILYFAFGFVCISLMIFMRYISKILDEMHSEFNKHTFSVIQDVASMKKIVVDELSDMHEVVCNLESQMLDVKDQMQEIQMLLSRLMGRMESAVVMRPNMIPTISDPMKRGPGRPKKLPIIQQ